jgi:hypothetical protein
LPQNLDIKIMQEVLIGDTAADSKSRFQYLSTI